MRWTSATDPTGQPVQIGVDAEGQIWISRAGAPAATVGLATEAQGRRERGQAVVQLPQGELLRSVDVETFAAWFAGVRRPRKVHSPLKITLILLAGFVLLLYALIRFVVPVLGDWAARWIPASLEQQLQQPVQQSLEARGFAPSQLPAERQQHYRALFAGLVADLPDRSRFVLEFRQFEAPNAFALPGGVVVFTDPIFALFETDDEFLAVAAHEIGHVDQRHIVRSLLRASTLTLLSAVLFGDVAAAASLAQGVPALLLQSAYSRDFEREADRYAFAMLKRRGVSPLALGHFLQRLSTHSGGELPGVLQYASSHPATAERIEAAEAAAR